MKKNDPKMFNEILEKIALGKSLVSVLKSKKQYPRYATFMEWVDEDKEKADKYARAKEEQADFLAEEIVDLSDEAAKLECDGFDNARVQAAKLRVDARKWVASKLKPKKYGDRIQHAGDPSAPVVITTITETKFSDDE